MKTNELRLGNLIYMKNQNPFNINWEGLPVTALHIMEGEWGMNPENYKPIPITAEWLERLGFKHKYLGNNSIYQLDESKFYIDIDTDFNGRPLIQLDFFFGGIDSYPQDIDHIEYIHQLQNLYFSLTGQELTIKEKV
jgi:hypothetical protein